MQKSLIILLVLSGAVFAGQLETVENYERRQEAARYEQYRDHDFRDPLGGYRSNLSGEYDNPRDTFQPYQPRDNYPGIDSPVDRYQSDY